MIAKIAENVKIVVILMTLLIQHASQRQLVSLALVLTAVRAEKVAVNHEKMRQPPKHQKMTLSFDATFAKANDVAVMVMTAPVNQRMLLVHQRMSLASRRTLPVNLALVMNVNDVRVAREAASHEKTKKLQKHQKMILNFDATFAKATDVDAVVMTTALVNPRTSLVNLVMIAKIAENVQIVVILMTLLMN